MNIEKNLVFNKSHIPIAVLISYEDWLKIEKILFENKLESFPENENSLSAGGFLEKYKDLNKIQYEKQAWENAILDEYKNS